MDDGEQRHDRATARGFVTAQMLLLAIHVALRPRDDWPTPRPVRRAATVGTAAGVAIAATAARSLGHGLTASPLPNTNAALRQSGLFALVRHPIYSGMLLAVAAGTIASRDRRQPVVLALLSILISRKAAFEERALARRFADYPAYAARTPRLLPHPGRTGGSRPDAAGGPSSFA